MAALRIDADFNGLVGGTRDPKRTAVVLDTIGSLRDLCNAGVLLREGLPLIAVDWSDDEEDLEGHGLAQYDPVRQWWVVEFDEFGVRYVPAGSREPTSGFHCVACRLDLTEQIQAGGLRPGDRCKACGIPIYSPLAPPQVFRNSLPQKVQSVVSNSQSLILYSLTSVVRVLESEHESFHGFGILKQVQVTEEGAKTQVVDAVYRSMADPEAMQMLCFTPHHGWRAVQGSESVDFVICYQCCNLEIYLNGTQVNGYYSTSCTSRSLFDDLLS